MNVRIINADVFEGLAQLPDDSVNCVVTSPPYWGLRDYGVPGQIGLEATLPEHLDLMVRVFREVRRVLRKDGTLWLNYGDAYCSTDKWGGGGNTGKQTVHENGSVPSWAVRAKKQKQQGIKPKDLMLLPSRLAIALCDDGWWIRSEIIWAKANPMPESVQDRPTSSHEKVFLLTKSARYFYDADAVRELAYDTGRVNGRNGRNEDVRARPPGASPRKLARLDYSQTGRNMRNVWEIATQPFKGSHFATMPPELAERCIKAGSPIGGTVLDPFGGAGTTGLVADRLGRNAVILELNPEYAEMARRRIENDAPMFAEAPIEKINAPTLFEEVAA